MDNIKGYCNHCNKFTDLVEVGKYYLCEEHKELKQYQPKRKKKPRKIKPFSKKRSKENKTYMEVRNDYLNKNPLCECCGAIATEIHHKAKRNDGLFMDSNTFMSICSVCHRKVHDNHEWAVKNGYIWTIEQTNKYLDEKTRKRK